MSTTVAPANSHMRFNRLLLILAVAAISCGCDVSVEVKQEAPSPDGRFIATVAFVGGGGGDSGMFFVNVRSANDSYNRYFGRVLSGSGMRTIKVRWTDPTTLVVTCVSCETVIGELRETNWKTVRVIHEKSPDQP